MNVKWAPLGDPVIIGRLTLQILQIGLFVASATFSMSETSLFSLRESDLDKLEERGQPPEMDFVTRSFLLGNASNNRRLTMYYCGLDLGKDPS